MQTNVSYNAIGNSTTAATLTATYSDNSRVLLSKYLENLHLDIQYTPLTGQTNRFVYITVEATNDEGTTYYQVSNKVVATTETDAYTEDTDGNAGSPIIVPGDKTSAGGTVYYGTVDMDVMADHVRIRAKESGAANFGTLFCRASLSSKV